MSKELSMSTNRMIGTNNWKILNAYLTEHSIFLSLSHHKALEISNE